MNSDLDPRRGAEYDARLADCERAAVELFRAELALHDARQSHVDTWIKAAGDKLHAAVERLRAAEAAADQVRPRASTRTPEARASR